MKGPRFQIALRHISFQQQCGPISLYLRITHIPYTQYDFEVMGLYYIDDVIRDSLDDHIVTFSENNVWQLTKKLSEKPWEGDESQEEADWTPSERHVVYECIQIRGSDPGKVAIMKVRIEYLDHRSCSFSQSG